MAALLAKGEPPETLIEHTENYLSGLTRMLETMPFLADISGAQEFFEHLFYAVLYTISGRALPDSSGNLPMEDSGDAGVRSCQSGPPSGYASLSQQSRPLGLSVLPLHKDIQVLGKECPAHSPRNPGYAHWQSQIAE